MNQAASEIPVPATATDGGSLGGAVEKNDDRVAMDVIRGTENVPVVFGLTYYSATYFYANELDNSSQPEMKHPKLEKGKRSQGSFFIWNKLFAIDFAVNKLVFMVALLCIGLRMWIVQIHLILGLMLIPL